jgi:hypothetical protein
LWGWITRRLAKNQKLHRELAAGRSHSWTKEPSGLLVNALTVPIDGEKAEKLIACAPTRSPKNKKRTRRENLLALKKNKTDFHISAKANLG